MTIDIHPHEKYGDIAEALKAVYNPQLQAEMAAMNSEKNFIRQALEKVLEDNFATFHKGVTTQLEKDRAFKKEPFKAKGSFKYYPLDDAGKKTSLPGRDAQGNILHRVNSIAAKDIIHLFWANLSEAVGNGGPNGYGYKLVQKNCLSGQKTNVCTPEGWIYNPLNANNSYVHYFVPKGASMKNTETGERTSDQTGETRYGYDGENPRKCGAIQLLNVRDQAVIVLDFTVIGEIEFKDYLL